MRISDWSSDVCSSDLLGHDREQRRHRRGRRRIGARQPETERPDARFDQERGAQDRGAALQDGEVSGWNLGDTLGEIEEHTSALQSLMRHSYAGFCLEKKNNTKYPNTMK